MGRWEDKRRAAVSRMGNLLPAAPISLLVLAVCISAPAFSQPVLPDPSGPKKVFSGRTAAESEQPDWPSNPTAPAGAPNVILIMTDDVGFGASSTFGGSIPTPALDSVAQDGLRYNSFNTTAICSPSRAA